MRNCACCTATAGGSGLSRSSPRRRAGPGSRSAGRPRPCAPHPAANGDAALAVNWLVWLKNRWWVVGEIAASLATDAPFCRRGREHAAARRADGSGPAVTDECSHRGVGITMPVRIAAVKTRASADPAGPLAIIGAMTVASATHRASGPLAANRGFELPPQPSQHPPPNPRRTPPRTPYRLPTPNPTPYSPEGPAKSRLRSPAVGNQPSETIADDEDDHADQDAATEGEQGRPAGRVRDRDPERSADNRRKKCTAEGRSQELAKTARRSR